MGNTTPEQEREEQRLANDLKHTLKLVPQSQRELFVFELAKYMLKRDAHNVAKLLQEPEPSALINRLLAQHYAVQEEVVIGPHTKNEEMLKDGSAITKTRDPRHAGMAEPRVTEPEEAA